MKYYINLTDKAIDGIKPEQLVAKSENIKSKDYILLYSAYQISNNMMMYTYTDPWGEDATADWKPEYSYKLTELSEKEADLVISYHNLILRKIDLGE